MEKTPTAGEHFFIPENYFRRLEAGEIFADAARKPLEVDLGCGDGGFLLAMAEQFPARNFLGVERFLGRVRKICRKAARAGLGNLKVLRLESAYTVEWLLPAGCAERVHLLFPDPWPKKRHHRRRLVDGEFLGGLAAVLAPGGDFCFKTDHAEYFEAALEEIEISGLFREVEWPGDEGGEDAFYPETDFERLWRGEGREVYRARFVKT